MYLEKVVLENICNSVGNICLPSVPYVINQTFSVDIHLEVCNSAVVRQLFFRTFGANAYACVKA
jgi:translation elongation factor EF-Ts